MNPAYMAIGASSFGRSVALKAVIETVQKPV